MTPANPSCIPILYSTTNPNARKAKILGADPRFACKVSTDEIDFILEGVAQPETDGATLGRVAEAYHTK